MRDFRGMFALFLAAVIIIGGLAALGILLYNTVVYLNNWLNPL
ncbi:MAG: hypothetical protein ACLGGU_02340 [Gammaproteobacteria bacterium]